MPLGFCLVTSILLFSCQSCDYSGTPGKGTDAPKHCVSLWMKTVIIILNGDIGWKLNSFKFIQWNSCVNSLLVEPPDVI